MPSFLFSPLPSTALLLFLFLFLFLLPAPICSHTHLLLLRTLHSSNNKPITESPEPNTKTKSTSSSSSSNLPKILPPDPTKLPKSKPNKTVTASSKTQKLKPLKPKPRPSPANSLAGGDLVSGTRDLPSAILSDLEILSAASKLFVGKKYAPLVASALLLLLLPPLFLVTALFRYLLHTGTPASLRRALLFAQAYLAIHFTTLSLTALVTGLEPLQFFHAVSPEAYAWTQAAQTFGYLVYLVTQLIALAVAFSAGEGKALGMGQMVVGLAVGMHYYVTVFHRAVTGEAPRANWKVHGIYALCFFVVCGLGRAERRKKAYLHGDGGDDSKKC